ncbi:MAG: 3-keto-5-aminohexanoate cleavage protein [Peptococcaceae bacterium]|nr:3-keto-5-aminohexanoate cleavage protein [Peptococcaceae bacterium]
MLKLPANKVIITVATTGAITRKAQNPNLPEQPDEIAQTAYECYNEGAAICHIHARDPQGTPTGSREVFREIHDKIRSRCNIVLNYTTGGGPNLSAEERIECLEANPEIASLNMGTMMRISGPYEGVPWCNSRKDIEAWAAKMRELGVKPEMEVYSHAMFREVENLIEKGLVEKPYYINLVLGMMYQGAVPATPKYLNSLLDFIPDGSYVNVCAVGSAQVTLTTLGMIMGTCVRVGMEDNIYYAKGELVKSNAQLVARTVRIARELGKEPCTPDEARRILGLRPLQD